jgi:hypothetical protein
MHLSLKQILLLFNDLKTDVSSVSQIEQKQKVNLLNLYRRKVVHI